MGGWLGHRHGVAPVSLPVPACSQGMSLLIHALGDNCYLHSGTQLAELGEEGGGIGPTGARAGSGGCRERTGSSSQDGVEERCS